MADSVIVPYLDCDHCGGVAIESESGMFGDGDGTACMSCGLPGRVSVDDADEEEVTAYWSSSDDSDDKCNEKDCPSCYPEDQPDGK